MRQIRSPGELGAILKAARTAAGIKQKDLSLATGRSVKFISEVEKGKAFGSFAAFLDLMQAAGAKVMVDFREPTKTDEGADP